MMNSGWHYICTIDGSHFPPIWSSKITYHTHNSILPIQREVLGWYIYAKWFTLPAMGDWTLYTPDPRWTYQRLHHKTGLLNSATVVIQRWDMCRLRAGDHLGLYASRGGQCRCAALGYDSFRISSTCRCACTRKPSLESTGEERL